MANRRLRTPPKAVAAKDSPRDPKDGPWEPKDIHTVQ